MTFPYQGRSKEPPVAADQHPSSLLWPPRGEALPPTAWDDVVAEGHGLRSADGLIFACHGLNSSGSMRLRELLEANGALQIRGIVFVYPACLTDQTTLRELNELSRSQPQRLTLRLVPIDRSDERPTCLMCWRSGGSWTLLFGPTGNLALAPAEGQVNILTGFEGALRGNIADWFEAIWGLAAPLNAETLVLPPLVVGPSDGSGEKQWAEYLEVLGEASEAQGAGGPAPSPTQQLGLSVGKAAQLISSVIESGYLVSIDESTRLRPLDAPVPPELVGELSHQVHGAARRQVSYRVSAFDKELLNELERFRKRTAEIVRRFSFPLGEGQRWMPPLARGPFEAQLEQDNAKACKRLHQVVGTEPPSGAGADSLAKSFVEGRIKHITDDLRQLLRDANPAARLSDDVIEGVRSELTKRLAEALRGDLLAKVNYANVQWRPSDSGGWASPWGSAFSLLEAASRAPRELLTDPYARRGLDVEVDEYLGVMNVFGDQLVADHLAHARCEQRALQELELIANVARSDAKAECKCDALIALIHGRGEEGVRAALEAQAAPGSSDPVAPTHHHDRNAN